MAGQGFPRAGAPVKVAPAAACEAVKSQWNATWLSATDATTCTARRCDHDSATVPSSVGTAVATMTKSPGALPPAMTCAKTVATSATAAIATDRVTRVRGLAGMAPSWHSRARSGPTVPLL